MVLDAYLREPDGSFKRSPRTTAFDVEEADRSVLGYGRDFDNDGAPDLILHAGGGMRIFRGDPDASRGRNLVTQDPGVALPWPDGSSGGTDWGDMEFDLGDEAPKTPRLRRPGAGFGPIRLLDLDGDGRPELILDARGVQGRGRMVVVTPPRRPGTP